MSVEPDPPSALALSIWYLIMATLALPLNVFIVWSTITRASLRAIPMNWLVLSAALADLAYSICLALLLCWSLAANELVCKMAGFGMYYFGMISIFTAPFLAGLRYKALSGNFRFSNVFSRSGVICIDCGIWLGAALIYLPFVFFDKLGLEKVGTCGITHNGNWYETPYFFFCWVMLFVAYTATFYFNRRLHSWVKNMSRKLISLTVESKVTLSDTQNLLKIFRCFLILPVVAFLPTAILQACHRTNIQILNIRIDRVVLTLIALPPLINPFVTIRYLKPYRLVLLGIVGSKIPFLTSALRFLFEEERETNWEKIKSNVATKVQAVYRISFPVLAKRNNSVSAHNSPSNVTLPSIVL